MDNHSDDIVSIESPWTFTVQQEFGVWCIQFSRCSVKKLIVDFSRTTRAVHLLSVDEPVMPGFPPSPKQWIENVANVTDAPDLLCGPEIAMMHCQAKVGFVQVDSGHASAFATDLSDLFGIWTAWLLQRFPAQTIEIDPHRTSWNMQISLLWPHPPGQWSQIRPLHGNTVTAFDIVDLGWGPDGNVFSRVRTRLVKTSDKSWRTGWMW